MLIDIDVVVQEFKTKAYELYGRRLKNIILYGSCARGKPTQDSDIDVAAVLTGNVTPGKEIDRLINVITEINLKYGVLLSVYPVSEKDYESTNSPLLINLRKEGVPV